MLIKGPNLWSSPLLFEVSTYPLISHQVVASAHKAHSELCSAVRHLPSLNFVPWWVQIDGDGGSSKDKENNKVKLLER